MDTASGDPASSHQSTDLVIEAYERHIDRMLLRASLARSVDERVQAPVELSAFAEELHEAGRKAGLRRD